MNFARDVVDARLRISSAITPNPAPARIANCTLGATMRWSWRAMLNVSARLMPLVPGKPNPSPLSLRMTRRYFGRSGSFGGSGYVHSTSIAPRYSYRTPASTRATLTVGVKGIRQSFTTQNDNRPGAAIDMRLVEGPFRSFSASWRFTALSAGACRIDFSLEYEFSSRILARLLEPLFDRVADTMVDAFARRADQVTADGTAALRRRSMAPGHTRLASPGV